MFSSQNSQVSSDANYIEDVFSTYLYTGNGSSAQNIVNGIDLAGKGGMVWVKSRSNATYNCVVDTARFVSSSNTQMLFTDQTLAANTAANEFGSFNSNGFSIPYNTTAGWTNFGTRTFASWTFREQPKFFDVVTYTGNGTSQTINHNLGSTPGFIICKSTTSARNWLVYHRSIGATKFLQLDTTIAATTASTPWNNTAPTSTTFTVGNSLAGNESGQTFVAYLFAHDAGGFGLTGTDNVISCGSFTTDLGGNFSVSLGYEPQLVIVKRTDATQNWFIADTMRGFSQTQFNTLNPNLSDAETTNASNYIAPNATGFGSIGNQFFSGSASYIYIAIRRGPMKVPTSGTSVFSPLKSTTTFTAGNTTGTLLSDWMWGRPRLSEGSLNWFQSSRLTPRTMAFNGATAEDATQYVGFDTQTGVRWVNTWTSTAGNYGSWYFRRAPNFFDEVCYTGTGNAMTVNHNLGVTPELMIVKGRSGATGWVVYTASTGATKYMRLDNTNAAATLTAVWNDTSPTSSVFTVGSNSSVNTASATYVAYLFATCAGVSKVGSYTGTGATQTISCGFTGGARFVLVKRTDSTGDWYVWDTARGMISGTDPSLLLNSDAAEVNANSIYTTTGGFQIVSTAAGINASGGTYIFLAIA